MLIWGLESYSTLLCSRKSQVVVVCPVQLGKDWTRNDQIVSTSVSLSDFQVKSLAGTRFVMAQQRQHRGNFLVDRVLAPNLHHFLLFLSLFSFLLLLLSLQLHLCFATYGGGGRERDGGRGGRRDGYWD